MKKLLLPLLLILLVLLPLIITTFSDAEWDRMTRFNNPADIICYSGSDKPVYTDRSTGMVKTSENGSGLFYRSEKTGRLIQLYMDCVIIEDKQ